MGKVRKVNKYTEISNSMKFVILPSVDFAAEDLSHIFTSLSDWCQRWG